MSEFKGVGLTRVGLTRVDCNIYSDIWGPLPVEMRVTGTQISVGGPTMILAPPPKFEKFIIIRVTENSK